MVETAFIAYRRLTTKPQSHEETIRLKEAGLRVSSPYLFLQVFLLLCVFVVFVVDASLAFSGTACPWMKPIVSLAHVQVGDMRVDFRGRNVAVSQQSLH